MSIKTPAQLRSRTKRGIFETCRPALIGLGLGIVTSLAAQPAFALSEIKREELPAPGASQPEGADKAVPLPDPIAPSTEAEPDDGTPAEPGTAVDPAGPDTEQAIERPEPDEPLPEIQYDVSKLPPAVGELRDQLLAIAKSGDIEKLRPLLGAGDDMTQLSLAGIDGDPLEYLKGLAGDEDGQEILAILEEVLSAGYVHLDAGTAEELYVWPYFFAIPIDKLTGPQRVELFKIVTAGDYEEMKAYGSYIFYRIGITPAGRWAFFVAGE
ncbi:hypothetical protein [Kumtagia ephedrae]|uniref:hypothetical protein n=1 Tax=Kumtagia ephedrae TaxID=2116701 RepID=UPI001FDED026|nr:hypothetical protein [Mesorhizobium ephedrae]